MIRQSLLATCCLAAAGSAFAAGPLQVTSTMLVEARRAASDGTTQVTLVKAAAVVPGDRVTVLLAYRNTGSQPIANLVLANPVPRNLAFRMIAPGSPAAEVSVDGRTFAPLAALRVAVADGSTRAASPDDVTHVRWRLVQPVAPGAQGQLAFQAVLK